MIPPALLYGDIIKGTDDPDGALRRRYQGHAMDGVIPHPPEGKTNSICFRFWLIHVLLFALQSVISASVAAATGTFMDILGAGLVFLLGPLGLLIAKPPPLGFRYSFGHDGYPKRNLPGPLGSWLYGYEFTFFMVGLPLSFFYIAVISISRKRIRAIGNHGDSTCRDCFSAWCCFPCALCQDSRATKIIGRDQNKPDPCMHHRVVCLHSFCGGSSFLASVSIFHACSICLIAYSAWQNSTSSSYSNPSTRYPTRYPSRYPPTSFPSWYPTTPTAFPTTYPSGFPTVSNRIARSLYYSRAPTLTPFPL